MTAGYECPRCHLSFTGLSTFDQHQDVDYSRPHDRMVLCRDPAATGMRRDRFGRWGSAAEDTRFPSHPSISAALAATPGSDDE